MKRIRYISYPQACLIKEMGGTIIPIMTYRQAERYIRTLYLGGK